jgi:DNA primase
MSQVREVKEATDLVSLIGERISLQRSGSSLRGLCPFHSEKSPSFFVNEQFQRYKCFGCGENGDAFTFLEKYEGMTFGEAMEYLAQRAGITLTSFRPTAEDEQRQRLLSLLNLTKEYYHFLLTKHEMGEPARQYLRERGLNAESIRLFQLGYALPEWDEMIKYLNGKKKYSINDLQQAGLVVTGRNNRVYDRFRDRIMFPLNNHRGQVVGFSGRVLDKDAKEAKYINSPETLLYHKSEMLYGYSELYQSIRKKGEVIVVEGEFDVISSAQAHVNNVVAIKGSAVTVEHLRLISRVATKVIFSLDADKAGVAATKRAIGLVGDLPLEVRVSSVPSGKDPDEMARTEPALWRETAKTSISVYDFLLQAALRQHSPTTPEGKRAIIDELAPIFGQISHAVEQEVYYKKLATALQTKEEHIRQDIDRFKQPKHQRRPAAKGPSSDSEEAVQAPVPLSPQAARKKRLEEYVVFLLLNLPEAELATRAAQLQPQWFSQAGLSDLITSLQDLKQSASLAKANQKISEAAREVVFEAVANPEYQHIKAQGELEKEWSFAINELQQITVKDKIAAINDELSQLDKALHLTPEQEARQATLLAEIVKLQKQTTA